MNLYKLYTLQTKKYKFTLVVILYFIFTLGSLQGQTKVFVMEIKEGIAPPAERYVELALANAKEKEADIVLIEMDTYGGRVDNADAIRKMILDFEKPVWVFINKNAASAGALISIACDSIYMASGSTMGAATVVTGDGNKASGKMQSYMAEKMRATAQAKGRNPEIAAAMVDDSVQVDSTQKGKVLTLTPEDAIRLDYCQAEINSIQAILKRNGLEEAEIIHYELGLTEQVIKIFLNPFVSGILLLVILGGIYFELQSPGVGFPLGAAILAAVLYFVPHYLNGLVAYWEPIVVMVGILFLMAEVFVIPGFGVAGVLGAVFTLGGLFLMSLQNDWFDFSYVPATQIYASLTSLTIALVGGVIALIFGVPIFLRSNSFKKISLQKSMNKDEGYNSAAFEENYVGKIGKAYTVLRPSGKISLDDNLHDAYTQGDFIEKGETVIVIEQEGTSLKVKKVDKLT